MLVPRPGYRMDAFLALVGLLVAITWLLLPLVGVGLAAWSAREVRRLRARLDELEGRATSAASAGAGGERTAGGAAVGGGERTAAGGAAEGGAEAERAAAAAPAISAAGAGAERVAAGASAAGAGAERVAAGASAAGAGAERASAAGASAAGASVAGGVDGVRAGSERAAAAGSAVSATGASAAGASAAGASAAGASAAGASAAGASVAGASAPAGPRPAWTAERVGVWVAAVLGAVLVVLATLFALAVAIDRGWLGPAARVLVGLVAGTGAWLGGQALRGRGHAVAGAAVAGSGMAALYGTLWAAAALYGLLPRPVAGAAMGAVTVVAILQATRSGDRFTAWIGLVGGLLTPLLVPDPDASGLLLAAWLAVLGGGAVAAAGRRGWIDLALGAGGGVALLHLLWTAESLRPAEVPIGLGGVLLLVLAFAAAAASSRDRLVGAAGLGAAVLLPLLALPWVQPIDPVFVDPRTGLLVHRDLGAAPAVAAASLPLLGLPGLLLARRAAAWPATLGAVLVGGVLAVAAASTHGGPEAPWLALGPLLAAALVARGPAGAPAVALAGVALASVSTAAAADGAVPAALGLALGALALLGVGAALRSRAAPWLAATLGGAALALAAATPLAPRFSATALGGATLLAYGLLVAAPLVARRWPGAAAWVLVPAGLAGPALYLPLDRAWREVLGADAIGLLPLALGGVALLLALRLVRVYRVHRRDGGLALLVGVALLGLAAAVPVQLERQWLTLAWAGEAALLALLAHRLHHPLIRAASLALGGAVAVRLLLNPAALAYGDTAGPLILNWTLYTWGVPALLLGLAATLLERARPAAPAPATVALRVLAVLVGLALVHVQVSHAFQDAGPVELGGHGLWQGMVRSVAWGAYGLAVLVGGLLARRRHVRLVGFGLVLLAAGKVFAVDLWSLEGFVRVGSVLGLGLLLLAAAFLFERLVLRGDAPAREVP